MYFIYQYLSILYRYCCIKIVNINIIPQNVYIFYVDSMTREIYTYISPWYDSKVFVFIIFFLITLISVHNYLIKFLFPIVTMVTVNAKYFF